MEKGRSSPLIGERRRDDKTRHRSTSRSDRKSEHSSSKRHRERSRSRSRTDRRRERRRSRSRSSGHRNERKDRNMEDRRYSRRDEEYSSSGLREDNRRPTRDQRGSKDDYKSIKSDHGNRRSEEFGIQSVKSSSKERDSSSRIREENHRTVRERGSKDDYKSVNSDHGRRNEEYDGRSMKLSRSDSRERESIENYRDSDRRHGIESTAHQKRKNIDNEGDRPLEPPLPKPKVLTPEEEKAIAEEEKKRLRRERLAQWKQQQKIEETITEVIRFEEPAAIISDTNSPKMAIKGLIKMKNAVKGFGGRTSVFQMEQSDTEEEEANKKDTTKFVPSSLVTSEVVFDDAEVDPLDLFMNDVVEEVERLNDTIQEVQDQNFTGFENTQEEIMMPEEARDLRDKKEVVMDLDDPDAILAPLASKFSVKKKDLISVNHSEVDYLPFRKDFWIEPPEFANMTTEELEMRRIELDNIKIRGLNCPKPINRWTQCGLTNVAYDIIQKVMKFSKPTSIQAQAIPAIMSGRDVICVAKTGSGKTLAFLLPLLRHVKDQPTVNSLEGPIALIMTPTRELALQIHRECKQFAKALNLRSVCVYGGAPIKDQIADLKRGAEIVICTPGRIIDLLSANNGRVTNLRRITLLVLDEADRMFDMGFEPQVMKIVMNIRPDAQTVLFSATFPRQMEALARRVLKKPVEISVGGKSVVCQDVTQHVEVIHEDSKFVRLLEILGKALDEDHDSKILIFVDKHESADNMLKDLMKRGYPCQALHGGQDQADRDSTIQDFKLGNTSILIATSVAARGLDVKQLKIVVNFECPNHMEDYVHRVGRTGRAGEKGEAYTFLTPDQDSFAVNIVKALKMSGAPVPENVAKLAEKYLEKIKSGAAKSVNTGYGGKGLERLEQDRNAKKQIQKTSHNTAEAIEEALDEEQADGGEGPKKEKDTDAEATDNVLMSLAKAKEVSAGLNATGKSTLKANSGCVAYEIEINDFPQQARWKITSKEILQDISQLTGAAVTVRGNYIPANRPVKATERKLYLYIEGMTKDMIDKAKNEVRRSLFEHTLESMQEGGSSAPFGSAAGRYSVL